MALGQYELVGISSIQGQKCIFCREMVVSIEPHVVIQDTSTLGTSSISAVTIASCTTEYGVKVDFIQEYKYLGT